MKVLVINASANKERSTTLKLTNTFLKGLGIEASEVGFVTTILAIASSPAIIPPVAPSRSTSRGSSTRFVQSIAAQVPVRNRRQECDGCDLPISQEVLKKRKTHTIIRLFCVTL